MKQAPDHVPHIGLVNLFACGNVGDEAILRCVAHNLRAYCGDIHLHSLAFGPCGFQHTYLPAHVNPMIADCYHRPFRMIETNRQTDWRRLLIKGELLQALGWIRRMDFLLWAGGYCIHDRRPAVMPALALFASQARQFGFYAAGAGPLNTAVGKFFTRRLSTNCKFMSVRDRGSKTMLDEAGYTSAIESTVDPAVGLVSCHDIEAAAIVEQAGLDPNDSFVVISPCAWLTMDDYYTHGDAITQQVTSTLTELALKIVSLLGHQVLILPTMWPEDGQVAAQICKQANDHRVRYVTQQLRAPEAQGVIGLSRALFSMRLHPLIFALNTQRPLVAFNYDRKVAAFMEQIQCSEHCLERKQFDSATAYSALVTAMSRNQQLRTRLKREHSRQLDAAHELAGMLPHALELQEVNSHDMRASQQPQAA